MAKKEKNIIENENPEVKDSELSSQSEENVMSSKNEPGSSKESSDSLEKHMENNQKDPSVGQKIHEDMAKQKEKKNIFQRVWGAIKKFVKGVGDLVSAAAVRLIYGKGAIQDLSKMEEMMMSPISDYKAPKVEKTKEKGAPEKEPEKQVEVKKVVKENREVTSEEKFLQEKLNNFETKQPFQNLLKSIGFEYENNPDKEGVITVILKNNDLGQMLKCDLELKDFANEPIQFNNILNTLRQFNDIRTYDTNHMPQMNHVINPQELRLKTAILTAGINQLLTNGKEASFEFTAYKQNLKMEITHTDTNDYAKIITGDGQEFEAFKPNGPEFFAYNSVEKIQDSLENKMIVIETKKALAEMQEKEAELAHRQTISYRIEQAEVATNPERNAWDDQFDKIISGAYEETPEVLDDEVVIEALEAQHNEPQYDDDDISL